MDSQTDRARRWLAACAAVALYLISRWGLNIWVYPSFHSILPGARELATATEVAACFVLIATLINYQRAARVVSISRLLAPALLAIGIACFLMGVQRESAPLLVAGALSYGLGGPWLFISAASTLLDLDAAPALLAVIAAALVQCGFSLLASLATLAPPLAFLLQALICLGCLSVGWKSTAQLPSMIHTPKTLSTALFLNPRSYIPASHPLFTSVVLSGVVCGVALTYGSNLSNPVQTPGAFLLFLVAGGIALLLVKSHRILDTLYLAAATLIVAGLTFFFPATFADASDSLVRTLPNLLFSASADCLLALALLVSAMIGRRNPPDFVRIATLYAGCICLGILGGAAIGHGLNALLVNHASTVLWAFAAGAVVFAFYNFLLLHGFSFDDKVEGVQRDAAPRVVSPNETFDKRCQAVAETFSLTPREAEVLKYYARGRSTNVVQEALVLSYNTVKTHVKNIYRKTGVHSQQELIDLVDGWTAAN